VRYRSMHHTTLLIMMISCSTLSVRSDHGGICDPPCGEYGTCMGSDTYVPGCDPNADPNKCEVFSCQCEYGWEGESCSFQYETCDAEITNSPDGARQCFNGGKCEEYEITEPPELVGNTGTRCNCQSLPSDTIAYAGHQCEFAAEEVCVRDAEHSTYSFCVNGGKCKEYIEFNEEHPLCDCPDGYVGRHCQFKTNIDIGNDFEISPEDEIKYVNMIWNSRTNTTEVLEPVSSESNDGLSGGMKFLILLLVLIVVVLPCIFCIRRRRRQKSPKTTLTTTKDITTGPDADWDTRDEEDDTNNISATAGSIVTKNNGII
jgi:hypothetical protein